MTQRLPWENKKDHAEMVASLVQMTCSLDASCGTGDRRAVTDADANEAANVDECWPSLSKHKTAMSS